MNGMNDDECYAFIEIGLDLYLPKSLLGIVVYF